MPQFHPQSRFRQAMVALGVVFALVAMPAFAMNGRSVAPASSGLQITALPAATVGVPYSAALTAAGGTAPYAWTASGLPAGLVLSAAGVLSGTPTGARGNGLASFVAKVADSSTPPLTTSATFGILILPGQTGKLQIDPVNLPPATVGTAYSDTLTAQGGTAPYAWTAANLPAGLTLSTSGVLTGTPTKASGAAGPSSFAVTVTDSSKTPLTATAAVSLEINPAATALTVTSLNLPAGTVGSPYSAQLTATGGEAPYAWKLGKGAALPAGLTLSASGAIGGMPTAATPASGFSFGVSVTDSSATPQMAQATLALVLNPAGPALAIRSGNLPPAYVGASYDGQLEAVGGTPPYTWALGKGAALPAGLTLSANGALSGTPTAVAASPQVQLSVVVTDSSAARNTVSGGVLLDLYPAAAECTHDGSGNAKLHGQYALAVSGYDSASESHLNLLGSFVANGTGTLTSVEADANAPEWSAPATDSLAGTYSIGTDDRGVFNLNETQGEAVTLCFVAEKVGTNGIASSGNVIRADESGQYLAGTFELQTAASFSVAALKGNYTVGLQGQSIDQSGNHLRQAVAGYVNLDGTGKVTAGEADMSQQRFSAANGITNQTETQIPLTGSYTVAASGRGTLQLNLPSGEAVNFAFQVVSAGELRLMEVDAVPAGSACCGSVLAGKALRQTAASFSNSTLKGVSVFLKNAQANPGTAQSGREIEAGLLTFDGNGNVSVLSDSNAAGSVQTQNTASATYSVDGVGRVTVVSSPDGNKHPLTAGTGSGSGGNGGGIPTFYLVGADAGFGVDSSTGVGFYDAEAQALPAGGVVSGAFGVGTMWPAPTAKMQTGAVQIVAGGVTATLDSNQNGLIAVGQSASATLSAASNGRSLLTVPGQSAAQQAVYVLNGSTAYGIDLSGSDSAPLLVFSSLGSGVAGAAK